MRLSFFKASIFTTLFLMVIAPDAVNAQAKPDHNDSYYTTYYNSVIPRVYFSKKNTSFMLPAASDGTTDLKYKANNRSELGIGLIHKWFAVNLGYDFDFVNPTDEDEKGKTKGLNMQLHAYPRRWVVDAVGLFQKGFYLTSADYFPNKPNGFTHRKDVKQDFVNLGAYRVSNSDKFSYKAAMVQNEWQKKSAGSFLYGGQAYFGSLRGDSALVPKVIEGKFPQAGVKKVNFFSIGPGAGYAYTLVMGQHVFVMGSLVGNVNLNFATEEGTKKEKKTSISPAATYKASVGYNSATWSICANYAGNSYWMQAASSSNHYFMPSDNFRITLEKKLSKK